MIFITIIVLNLIELGCLIAIALLYKKMINDYENKVKNFIHYRNTLVYNLEKYIQKLKSLKGQSNNTEIARELKLILERGKLNDNDRSN